MVARNSENRSRVKFVWFVELRIILGDLTIIIDAITGNVEKSRVDRLVRTGIEAFLHPFGDKFLRNCIFDPAHVAIDVEREPLRVDDRFEVFGLQDVLKGQVKGRVAGWVGQCAEMRIALRFESDWIFAAEDWSPTAEGMAAGAFVGVCHDSPLHATRPFADSCCNAGLPWNVRRGRLS